MYSNKLVCSILYFIDENIDRKISISDISERFFYNRYYVMKLFKKEIGVSPSVYRKFVLNRDFVSDDERMIISNNFTELREFVLKKEDYLRREKPDNIESKKLTIFKWMLAFCLFSNAKVFE